MTDNATRLLTLKNPHCLHCVITYAIIWSITNAPRTDGVPSVSTSYIAEKLAQVTAEFLSVIPDADQRAEAQAHARVALDQAFAAENAGLRLTPAVSAAAGRMH